MNDTKSDTKSETKSETKVAPGVWGKKAAQFYAELQGQQVVVLTSGERYAGTLVGVDVYDIIIRQSNGLEMLLSKGNVVYVHRSTGVAKESKS